MAKLIIDYSGTAIIEACQVNFVSIGSDKEKTITGNEWLDLSNNEKSDFVLESLVTAIDMADDIIHSDISVEEDL